MPIDIVLASPRSQTRPVLDEDAHETKWCSAEGWGNVLLNLKAHNYVQDPDEIAYVKVSFVTHAEVA